MHDAMSLNIDKHEKWLASLFILYAVALPISISATNIAEGLIFIFGFVLLYHKGTDQITIQVDILILFILFFSWSIISAVISDFAISREAFSDIWEYTPIILFPLFLSLIKIKKERIVMPLLTVASIVCFLGILQYFFPSIIYPLPRQLSWSSSFVGFQSNRLHTGGLYSLITILTFALILFWNCDKRIKFYLWIVFILNLTATSLSMTRSYYISVSILLPFLLFKKNWKWFIPGISAFIIIFAVILSASNTVGDRFKTLIDPSFASNRDRIYIWKSAIEMIKDHPLAGIGKGNFEDMTKVYFPRYKNEWLDYQLSYGHAHNSYLTCGAETGIIGLILFISFWTLVIWNISKTLSKKPNGGSEHALSIGSLAGLCNLFIAGMFENNFGTSIILLLLSLLVGLSLSATKES